MPRNHQKDQTHMESEGSKRVTAIFRKDRGRAGRDREGEWRRTVRVWEGKMQKEIRANRKEKVFSVSVEVTGKGHDSATL